MQISTEEDMNSFCERALQQPRTILIEDYFDDSYVEIVERLQDSLIAEGALPPKPISHLQQGIIHITHNSPDSLLIVEKPLLFPAPNILTRKEIQEYLGPITGVLVNCYDPCNNLFLFHMRGKSVDSPFGFQAAAAGMGQFRENPAVSAKRELYEEAGLQYSRPILEGRALDCLPFMKGKVPQPLFSFGFINDLSRFPVCKDLDAIAEFESTKKAEIISGEGKVPQEGYHFSVPLSKVEEIARRLNEDKRFYGPIYQSISNFMKVIES